MSAPLHFPHVIFHLHDIFQLHDMIHLWKGRLDMEIPISGFVVHSGEDGRHTHQLYITHWNQRPVHTHDFAGATSYDVGHRHHYAGRTAPAPSGIDHTHRFETVTTFDDGHRHLIRGVTGPAIPLPGGGHIHYFEGVTTVDGRIPHAHMYRGQTGPAI